ncbi:hypothetical protein [Xanthomonas albilineans]|uniref:hypothetical protein n=1 Tax=Xanthomonas albilineans TaxID=29447 RepID=UPI0005F3044C|nr:hypothetical protein [Xanthomonas albilineans]PPU94275.1 hypothetical protein XalbCFBP2523_04095 [Xanthomonas albilineans]
MTETAQKITILGQRLADAMNSVSAILSTTEGDAVRSSQLMHMRSLIEYVQSRLQSTDLSLALSASLDNVDGSINTALGELNSYQVNGNVGHLTNATNNLFNALRHADELPLPMALMGETYPAQAVESLRASAEQALIALGSTHETIRRDFAQLQGKVASLTQQVENQNTRLDKAMADQQGIFQKAQEDRLTTNAAAMAELAEKAQGFRNQLSQDASGVISEIEHMRDQARDLLQIIGNTGMAGEYTKTANRSLWVTWAWQVIAVLSLLALVCFAFHAYSAITDMAADISHILGRVFVAATFGVLAAYASRQADQANRIEERNRRYALVLSSIDPYLANLEPEQRTAVKIDLAKNLFTQPVGEPGAVTDGNFDGNAKDFMQLLIQLTNAFKSVK